MEMSTFKDTECGYSESSNEFSLLFRNENDVGNLTPKSAKNFRKFSGSYSNDSNTQLQINVSKSSSICDITTEAVVDETISSEWWKKDKKQRRLNTELLEAIEKEDSEKVESLLKDGANPNATCRLELISACHMAAVVGGNSLSILLKYGAEKYRRDKFGLTPLHYAAIVGSRQLAVLLNFNEDMIKQLESENWLEVVNKSKKSPKDLVDVPCDSSAVRDVPNTWKDNIDHNCRSIRWRVTFIKRGWTPLHVATSCVKLVCTRLLLAAGAEPNTKDESDRTSLDVAGSAYYHEQSNKSMAKLTDVIKTLFIVNGTHNTMKLDGINDVNTPLHTAVELNDKDTVHELLSAGVSIACLNTDGLTPLHICVKNKLESILKILANYAQKETDQKPGMINVKDKGGRTVLQAAVKAGWKSGVCIALEAGADVTLKDKEDETPIHSAATLEDSEVLTEILSGTKQECFINSQNVRNETPLHKAIIHNRIDCVKSLLDEKSIKFTMPGNMNVFHIASALGHTAILEELFKFEVTETMLNALSTSEQGGFGPIHFAVENNKTDCVDLLLSKNANIKLKCNNTKGETPLHLAAIKNHYDVAKKLLHYNKSIINELNNIGWFPLHSAAYHGSRDVIILLLREGANLAVYTTYPSKHKNSAVDMVVNSLVKPTQFLKEVFDTYITSNGANFSEPRCKIIVNYSILMPDTCEMDQMKVIEALIDTGNRDDQHHLLRHPLIESFLHLKWKAFLPVFYAIIAVNTLFTISFTIFTVSIFYFKDNKITPTFFLKQKLWSYVVYVAIFLIVLLETLYISINYRRHCISLEFYMKCVLLILASSTYLAPELGFVSWPTGDLIRYMSTTALLLSWTILMLLLSRFPNLGFYVLIFGRVATKVIKILLFFMFLLIGFSLSFFVLFHGKEPFESPLRAFIKTIVMMTSEFEYENLFKQNENGEHDTSSIFFILFFLSFLIFASIVLMNLVVTVAVNDVNNLEELAIIEMLVKQVEFLGTLEKIVCHKLLKKILTKSSYDFIKSKTKVIKTLILRPGDPYWKNNKRIPFEIRDAILDKIAAQKKQEHYEISIDNIFKKINALYKEIV